MATPEGTPVNRDSLGVAMLAGWGLQFSLYDHAHANGGMAPRRAMRTTSYDSSPSLRSMSSTGVKCQVLPTFRFEKRPRSASASRSVRAVW